MASRDTLDFTQQYLAGTPCPSPLIGPQPLLSLHAKLHLSNSSKGKIKIKIRVGNPVRQCLTYIPLKNAEQYVARGRARWADDYTIWFLEDSYDRRAAECSAVLDSQLAYDRIGRMSIEQVKGVPVVGDPLKLFMLR